MATHGDIELLTVGQRLCSATVLVAYSAFTPALVDRLRAYLRDTVSVTFTAPSGNPTPRWYWGRNAWGIFGAICTSALLSLILHVGFSGLGFQDHSLASFWVAGAVIFGFLYYMALGALIALLTFNAHATKPARILLFVMQGLPFVALCYFAVVYVPR